MERLKERARSNGRSLQKEVKTILEEATETYTMAEAIGSLLLTDIEVEPPTREHPLKQHS